jgi:tetratricopeptide (TPR) repeat protein
VGDPLYRPFAKGPLELVDEFTRTHNPLVQWAYLRAVNAQLFAGMPLSQAEDNLENLPLTATSAVLTEKLADLCDAQGKPESAILYYQNALQLDPSPEQRIRIRLALGRELAAQGDDAEAIADYRALLSEFPDYPGTNTVSDQIAALEPKENHSR